MSISQPVTLGVLRGRRDLLNVAIAALEALEESDRITAMREALPCAAACRRTPSPLRLAS
jgi:hypothetical protein